MSGAAPTHEDSAIGEVLVSNEELMRRVFPKFNEEESHVVQTLTVAEKATLARTLRKVALQVEPD